MRGAPVACNVPLLLEVGTDSHTPSTTSLIESRQKLGSRIRGMTVFVWRGTRWEHVPDPGAQYIVPLADFDTTFRFRVPFKRIPFN